MWDCGWKSTCTLAVKRQNLLDLKVIPPRLLHKTYKKQIIICSLSVSAQSSSTLWFNQSRQSILPLTLGSSHLIKQSDTGVKSSLIWPAHDHRLKIAEVSDRPRLDESPLDLYLSSFRNIFGIDGPMIAFQHAPWMHMQLCMPHKTSLRQLWYDWTTVLPKNL